MKLCLVKRGNTFVPADSAQFDIIATIPSDFEIIVDISRPRNPKNHRRYFAFMKLAFDMQETFKNVDQLRHYLQLRAWHYEPMVTHKGKTIYRPLSIAWHQLSEDDFRKLFREVVHAYLDFYNETHEAHIDEEMIMRILDFA